MYTTEIKERKNIRKGLLISLHILWHKATENHPLEKAGIVIPKQKLANLIDRRVGRLITRVAIHAGTDRGEGNRLQAVLDRKLEAVSIAAT